MSFGRLSSPHPPPNHANRCITLAHSQQSAAGYFNGIRQERTLVWRLSAQLLVGRKCSARSLKRRHVIPDVGAVTSSAMTLKLASVHGPNEVTIATSVASRPRAIRMRPIRGVL